MRYNISKRHSTKGERLVYEVLKELRIPFRHRWIIRGREIDFVFSDIALEINGHEQDAHKNQMLAEAGYRPIHLSNDDLKHKDYLITFIKQLQHGK